MCRERPVSFSCRKNRSCGSTKVGFRNTVRACLPASQTFLGEYFPSLHSTDKRFRLFVKRLGSFVERKLDVSVVEGVVDVGSVGASETALRCVEEKTLRLRRKVVLLFPDKKRSTGRNRVLLEMGMIWRSRLHPPHHPARNARQRIRIRRPHRVRRRGRLRDASR